MTSEKKPAQDREPRSYASPPCYQHELAPLFREPTNTDNWASIRRWRAQQRKQLVKQRRSLGSSEFSRAGTEIVRVLKEEPRFVGASVASYWPLEGEVDLRPFMQFLLRCDVGVALPVIVRKNAPLEFWSWDESSTMQAQVIWNIPAPAVRNVIRPEVVLVPLLGFDEQGHRLGHGGGYYDRTLADVVPAPLVVGIGYAFGRLTSIYPQPHDIPMDAIVTEKGVTWHSE